jgi:hypothetical protein
MCIIVDNNVRRLVLLNESDPNPNPRDGKTDYRVLYDKLFRKRSISIAYGGKLENELTGDRDVKARLQLLEQAGKVRSFKASEVAAAIPAILAKNPKSDDEHILALMMVSGTRLVCTKDKDLRTDIANKQIIDDKRGKVYKNPTHDNLLNTLCPLKGKPCH